MSLIDLPRRGNAPPVDRAALDDALELAATRCGRLTDEQVAALRRRRRRTAVAAPAVAAAVAALVVADLRLSAPATVPNHWVRDFSTAPGQRGSVALVDGTTIRLNGATMLRVDYTAGERTARLVAGQAYFDVHHDLGRPFTVKAGPGEIRVLGTAFDLDLTRRHVTLAVYRGAVRLGAAGLPQRVIVRAGYRSGVSGGEPDRATPFDRSLPDWRQGWIDASGMRLDDLVDVLGRQGRETIVPPTGPLAAITVTGRFRTDRPRELLGAIGDGFGFTVVSTPSGLVLTPDR